LGTWQSEDHGQTIGRMFGTSVPPEVPEVQRDE
jgi:hypothetical protein